MAGEDITDAVARRWKPLVLVFWIIAAIYMLHERWGMIAGFVLPDTDDNMRMMQVRALLHGQGWFDLRQYRLDPPFGANIHWSRVVDLPIAAIILLLRPITGGLIAEKAAVALAPMLPMMIAMAVMAVAARRLVAPKAFALAIGLLLCAHSARLMWAPMRIDHHGWQLAFVSLIVLGLTDTKLVRSGLTIGLASAGSLIIGMEMLPYFAIGGAVLGLLWVRRGEEAPRLLAYGASLGGGSALGYLLFASDANRLAMCDALSPIWLSTMAAAGAGCVLLALLRPASVWVRLVLGGAVAASIAGGFVLAWPNCLHGLEQVSPEAQRLWLDRVREAKPIYEQSATVAIAFSALPILGLIGYATMLWRSRRDPELWVRWAAIGLLALASAGLLLWQTRAGPAAQMLAVPGATGLAWLILGFILGSRYAVVRVLGAVAAFLLVSGIGVQLTAGAVINSAKTPRMKQVDRANAVCPTMAALRPIALVPKGYVLTFVDLGPRLITVTHHDAVAGPYHRNYRAIIDVMNAFRGAPEAAHAMIDRRRIDYVLICPGFSEATNYEAMAPHGFYAQLAKGQAPAWLQPVPLPKKSPFRMWRVVRT